MECIKQKVKLIDHKKADAYLNHMVKFLYKD